MAPDGNDPWPTCYANATEPVRIVYGYGQVYSYSNYSPPPPRARRTPRLDYPPRIVNPREGAPGRAQQVRWAALRALVGSPAPPSFAPPRPPPPAKERDWRAALRAM